MDVWMDGVFVVRWMDGWMDESVSLRYRKEGWMDGWINGLV